MHNNIRVIDEYARSMNNPDYLVKVMIEVQPDNVVRSNNAYSAPNKNNDDFMEYEKLKSIITYFH